MQQHLVKGFNDPVQAAQQVFRQTLTALSEPGVAVALDASAQLPGLYPSTTALLLTLLDQDTPLWLADGLHTPELTQNLVFHCGCPMATEQVQGQFAVYDLAAFLAAPSHDFALGNERYPDLSATVIIQLPTTASSVDSVWRGPGILNQRDVALPMPAAFWALRQKLIAFPRGVDFLFTFPEAVMGLPRTTVVTPSEESVCM
ncbi:MAG: phosphonate C-P lyase system protein PhnH [Neisseriaceae bacterium]|nr:phosphonate C-P lyase system protein PhnH [Neisseriaceae bacterium]